MEETKVKKIKIARVSEFKSGKKLFRSTGISSIKVTDDNEVICYEIPIESTGISELIESFQNKAPIPPEKKCLVTPDSEIGKEMGLSMKKWVYLPDFTDEKYIKDREEHGSAIGMAIVLKGMSVPIKDADGTEIKDEDKKIEILKEMGMSSEQFTQLASDITSLTKWTEEEKNSFLSE